MESPAAPRVPVNCAGGASAALPLAAAQHPPPTALPPYLQHAVHRALSDLQAARLIYPQQCAQAEAAGCDARQEAEGRTLAALGGTFEYASARAELERGRQAIRKLAGHKSGGKGSAAAADLRTAASAGTRPAALPSAALPMHDAELWSSYEAFSVAVAAEVDKRIVSASLHPQAAAPGQHPRQRERKQAVAAADRSAFPRLPLGRVQQQVGAPAAHERKRDRSPQTAAPSAVAQAVAGGRGPRQGQVAPAAAPAGSPASKRPKPHVAFGTRCDGPRPSARGSRPVRLEASVVPTPPALAPAEPEALKPRSGDTSGAPSQAASTAARSDLLRSLAAAFAGGTAADDALAVQEREQQEQPAGDAAGGGAWPAAAGPQGHPEELQRMLEQLTAGMQGLASPASSLPSSKGATSQSATSGCAGLQSVLQQHGLAPAAADGASALLQAVLDRMDDIVLRTGIPAAHLVGSPAGAPRADVCPVEGVSGPAGRSQAARLCSQADELLDSSAAELRQVQHELEVVQRLEVAAERIGDAAIQAALAGAKAAAQAATARTAARSAEARAAAAVALPELAAAVEGTHDGKQRHVPRLPAPPPHAAMAAADEQPEADDAALDATLADPCVARDVASPRSAVPGAPAAADLAAHAAAAPAASLQPSEPAALLQPAQPAKPAPPAAAEEGALTLAEPVPATGWPVPWQLPSEAAAVGMPLLLPAPGQPQWLLPAAHGAGFGWQFAVPAAQPLVAAGQAQPAAAPPAQRAPPRVGVCQHKVSLSVASDEILADPADSNGSSTCAGLSEEDEAAPGAEQQQQQGTARGPEAAVLQQPGEADAQQQRHGDEQQAEQRMLDDLAALSIQQYQQYTQEPLREEAVASTWDAATAAWGPVETVPGADVHDSKPWPAQVQGDTAASPSALAASPTAAAPESSVQLAASDCGLAVPVVAVEAAALVAPAVFAAPTAPPRPRQPYQPLRVAEERAAAARQQEAAAGWRQLRERADMLALWHQYAAELGIDGDSRPGVAGEAGTYAAAAPSAPSPPAQEVSVGVAVPRQLWQPAAQLAAAGTAVQPPLLATSPPAPSVGTAASSERISSAPLTASSDFGSTPLTASSAWSEDSEATSLGVAGRHKARALRYRLLRRQLAAAAGLQATPLGTEAGSPALSLISSASDGLTSSSSGGGSPIAESACNAAEHAPAAARFASLEAAAGCVGAPENELPATPTAAGLPTGATGHVGNAGGASALPSPRHISNLADHLSDATPSSCPASASPPTTATPPSTAGASTCSTLSTLQEVDSRPWGAQLGPLLAAADPAAAPSTATRTAGAVGGGRGLEALRVLKDRMAAGRRTPGVRS